MNPAAAFALIENPEISGVADEVRSRHQRVIDAI